MNYRNATITYNSFLEEYKTPFGAIKIGDLIRIRLKIEGAENPEVTLVLQKEGLGEEYILMENTNDGYHEHSFTSNQTGLYFYYFKVNYKDYNNQRTVYVGTTSLGLGGEQSIKENLWDIFPYQITFHNYVDPAPEWYKESIFYQIFVDRFYNGNEDDKVSNPKYNSFLYATWADTPMYIKDAQGNILRWDFFGGNLKGVIKKLDYLKSMGIGGIYLNPIFKARSNHKYDTGDFLKIDEMFGDEEIFKTLISEAEKRGMKIVLDGVFNHVGDDSIYFNAYGNYDELGAAQSKDSKYYEWFNFKDYPTDYECWWGVKDLPNVNEHNPSYREFIVGENGVIQKWSKLGLGGWRLDVADELPDDFIKDIRIALEQSHDDQILIGEVWEDASNKVAYGQRRKYLLGEEIHSTMNYPFKDNVIGFIKGQIRARQVYTKLMSLKENYPKEAFYSALNNLGTHDTRRIYTELDRIEHLDLAVGMLFTYPGVPCIYYGDEAGMKGEADPYNRGPYPWGYEKNEIMDIYKRNIELRNSSLAFTKGDFIPFYQENLFGYLRVHDEDIYLIMVNRDLEDFRLVISDAIGLEAIDDHIKHKLDDEYYIKRNSFECIKV